MKLAQSYKNFIFAKKKIFYTIMDRKEKYQVV